jgi:asparagine synthase (glutamine-hydrolysing)
VVNGLREQGGRILTDAELVQDISRRLRCAIDRCAGAPGSVTLLFSGGLDSSLLAFALRDRPATELVTVGLPGSPDLEAARTASDLLGLSESRYIVSEEEALRVRDQLIADFPGPGRASLSVAVSMAIALQRARASRVLCGQGADELFLGYAHFAGLDAERSAAYRRIDLEQLDRWDWPLTRQIAASLGKSVESPYLDPDLRPAILGIPVDRLGTPSERKEVLRSVARAWGLPEPITERPKRAFQFGSGIERALVRGRRPSLPALSRGRCACPSRREGLDRVTAHR